MNEENEIRFEYAGETNEVKNKKSDFKEAVRDLLEENDEPMFKKEIFGKLKETGVEGGYSTFKEAIKELGEKGEIFEKRGKANKIYYSLKPFEENQLLF
jgi:hypothetical protein